MNKIKLLSVVSILLLLTYFGCDTFQEDLQPTGEDQLSVKSHVSVLPNTSILIDLKRSIKSADAVRFQLNKNPDKGSVEFLEGAILKYTPNQGFNSGSDFFTLDLLNTSDFILDTDSIFIEMSGDTTDIPCFNGALSDHYGVNMDTKLNFNPVKNDGYCIGETSGAILNFISNPAHGALKQVELFTYEYTPNVGFVGVDEFMYELELVDHQGNSNFSKAFITIDVVEYQDTTENECIYPTASYYISSPLEESYTIPAFTINPACTIFLVDFEIEIVSVGLGTAQVIDHQNIQYFPHETDSIDHIDFIIRNGSDTIQSEMIIFFDNQRDSIPHCAEAIDDALNLTRQLDSLGNPEPFYLSPLDNDDYCFAQGSTIGLTIIQGPKYGDAHIIGDHIEYLLTTEVVGKIEDEIQYQLCDGVECDLATIYLTIE